MLGVERGIGGRGVGYCNARNRSILDHPQRNEFMKSKTILIADDDAENTSAFSKILSAEQFSVLTAANGAECLRVADQAHPDLILLDVNMPIMDGFETIKRLRANKQFKHTPIVFLTGFGTTPTAIDSGYILGSTEYWMKPIVPAELIVRVRAILRVAEAEQSMRKLQQSFYSMVVHDLRNPIGAILGYSEIMMDDVATLTSDQRELVSDIHSAGGQLLQIVKDLLELSNFEFGEYSIERVPVRLSEMVSDVVASMDGLRNQKNIAITMSVDDSLVVSMDEEYGREVIENLLNNSIRFTPAGGKVTVAAEQRPPNGDGNGSTTIEVSDSGCGISEAELPVLFEKKRIIDPKFRKANTRTGLGLVICREIVEAHNGTISVESSPGKGSKFIVTLPE